MEIADGSDKIIPHLLTMTATPIPRTLAIAFFGSLDLSILDEMPKNRKPIITKIVTPNGRKEIYNFIRSQINSGLASTRGDDRSSTRGGRQVFVIFPLVEESKALSEVKAATEEHKKLSETFSEFKIGLMHGRLKAKEKETVMQEFKDKKTQILVSTSVVEVGIDVPNATVMIIENAERFGLSQLHQFRGRVGRSEYQSYCFLFTDSDTRKSIERLQALEKTNDGFEISKIDLELRGPGQFFGHIQSGLPDITMENLTNVKLIKFAREEAQNILATDPQLKKHPLLADALRKFSEKIHLE
jgi:ATP-dependent DNA helicase RecG